MTKKSKNQPVTIGARKRKARYKTRHKNQEPDSKVYKISITKRDDFTLDDAERWIDEQCKGKCWHKIHKKNIVFSFRELDDAFKFKFHYERA